MTPGRTQGAEGQQAPKLEAPSTGDLPPEFVQETQAIPPPPAQPPVEGTAAGADGSAAPPPVGTPPMVPATIPVGEVLPTGGEGAEAAAIPVEPQFASDDQYTYDPTGRRDPFKPYRTYRPQPTTPATATTTAKPAVESSDPLQRWDLDRFAIVAIMWEVRHPKAMVKDPDGKLYMITKNTVIGRNSGYVAAIREGEVVVVESIDNEGVQTKEVKILELKK